MIKARNLILLIAVFFIFFKFYLPQIPIQQELTLDSQLYYGLAKNLVSGKGYFDTIRNDEILPPIGHPILLSLSILLNPPITIDQLLVFFSFVLVGLAIWNYSKKILPVVISIILMFVLVRYIGFYKYSIEISGFFTSSLLIFFLVNIKKNVFSFFNIFLTAFSLTLNVLVRPTLLYLIILICPFLLIYIVIKKIKKNSVIYQLLITFLLSLFTVFLIYGYSIYRYKDERLIRGTYASLNFYLSNNPYLPINEKYKSNNFTKYIPENEKKIFLNKTGWKNREILLFNKAISYIKNNPKRALQGWSWRLNKYIGSEYNYKHPLYLYGLTIKIVFILMLLNILLTYLSLKTNKRNSQINFFGLIISLLLFFQIFQLIFFSWTGERYLIFLIPYLVASLFFLVKDCSFLLKNQ